MEPSELEDVAALVQRANVLDACRDGPADRSTISKRAGCSRSTAYRATGELSDRGLLERSDRGYRLTGSGAAMLDHVRQFVRKLAGTERIQPLLSYVDDPEFVRRAHLFESAELVTQDASSPYRIENRVKALIDDTRERMLGMTTSLGSPSLSEAMFRRIRAGTPVEWIGTAEMYDQFESEHGTLSAQAVEDEQTAVYVTDEIQIDLVIYDETLLVVGFDRDRGVIGTVAITDEPAALRWAEEIFEDCRSGAEQVE